MYTRNILVYMFVVVKISGKTQTSRRESFPPKNFGKGCTFHTGKIFPQNSENFGKLPDGKISSGVLFNNILCFSIKMRSKRVLKTHSA